MIKIERLSARNISLMKRVLTLFGEVFDDMPTYTGSMPSESYLGDLLSGESFIALAALKDQKVVGAVAAYDLKKFEQERSEIYIYDLAVSEGYRRQGVATALINRLKHIAAQRSAHVMFVQADKQEEDQPAISLYRKMGSCEDVFHFDIEVS